ncbi:MAG: TadE/TadG family type IV pilus assembly protein [Pseudomonadota bacterium]
MRRDEAGAATIEFCLLFPLVFSIFLMFVELSMVQFYRVALERGTETAARAVRLNTDNAPTPEQLKTVVCDAAFILSECLTYTRVGLERIDPATWVSTGGSSADADCYDQADPDSPPRNFDSGSSNDLVLMRTCKLFRPYFPTTLLGSRLAKHNNGFYAIVTTTVLVMEPTEEIS